MLKELKTTCAIYVGTYRLQTNIIFFNSAKNVLYYINIYVDIHALHIKKKISKNSQMTFRDLIPTNTGGPSNVLK